MTISKGISQEQVFFESHYYSHQNGPQPEFHTYRHKTSAREYFLENKASLMIFSHFKARLKFLSDPFCLNWKKLILKVFNYMSYIVKTFKINFLQFKQKGSLRNFNLALK